MPAHHFQNHDAIVRLSSRVQTIEGFGSDIERGYESERQLSAGEIVIDRLRHTADRNAALVKLIRDRECAFTTQDHERVDANDLHVGDRFLIDALRVAFRISTGLFDEAPAVTLAENRSATW